MAKAKGKEKGADASAEELGPYSDPEILYKNYVKECAAINIEAYGPVKDALTNADNPNRGKQIIVFQPTKEDGNYLGPDGCRALVNAIIAQPFLAAKDIRISGSQIQDSGAAALGSLLAAAARQPSIEPSDQSALQPVWKLEYLELINNDIGHDGALALGRSLFVGMNRSLATLILDFNPLGSAGLAALCKGLQTNSTLKKLSVRFCNIDERGGKPMGEVLRFKRTGLISLDLTSNRLSALGLRDICVGMDLNTSLKTLRLADISLGQSDDDAEALGMFAGVLRKHPSIVAVDLSHNNIGTKGGNMILPAVTENKSITEFKVDSRMDEELFKALFRASAPPTKKKPKGKESK
ncbi:hypothetical protein ACHAW5_008182 [Stephanodiscus triporus]|uniref:Uncharacterized protein n=1 Tax=Stephanodiscus triporus TaxID=2934178 RepID=A0ABD3NCK3_9STRA